MKETIANKSQVKKKLLVVEDSKDFQLLLKKLFSSEGYEVETASNGLEALEKIRSQTRLPNLILLDLMMPVMNGSDCYKELQLDSGLASIPVVVMTAHGDKQPLESNVNSPEFVRKPFDMKKLIEIVKKRVS